MMNKQFLKWAKFSVRWGIAAFGVWYVLAQISFHDRVTTLDPKTLRPMEIRVTDGAQESAQIFHPFYSPSVPIPRADVWTPPDRPSVTLVTSDGSGQKAKLLAVHPQTQQAANKPPIELLIQDPRDGKPRIIPPDRVKDGYRVRVPHPLLDVGLIRLVREANPWLLLAAVLVLPIGYLITARRWHMLLETLDIHMGQGRTFVLNMVGAFYNSFMPGSTGGDLVKAYYASKHTTHRTRAILSVIVDRILGLIALIIVGGVMASTQWQIPTCRRVALASGGLLLLTAVGLIAFYHRSLRRRTGLQWLIDHMPMQRQVHKAVEAMEMYGKRPRVMIGAVVMTFPVHMTTILSATLAGKAFGLTLSALYYWAVVPVIILVGAIPISPQGAGVMEYFGVELTRRQGVTVGQAFALVMAIRFCQIFWNLTGALFVLRGGFHAPTQREAETLDEDTDPNPPEAPALEPALNSPVPAT